ncbi:hypothetical protein IACHDJAJ_00068 [Aeromonas phage vB_AdhS_TS3]|nr:hypothetical protein IACHDJAJ_00068 [Aeromonas phage vB_AdhS_TS3]
MIKLFKTENCPACKALLQELTKRNIPYEVVSDLTFAAEHGIRSAPAILTKEGTVLRTSQEIMKFLKAA